MGVLTVRQALERLPDGTYVLGAPKVDSYRVLRLPADLVALLRAHRLAQRKARLSAEVWEDHGLVFTNALRRPIDASNMRRTVVTYAKQANVGHLSPNELRHSAASLLVANGTPPGRLATCSAIATSGCWPRPTGTRSARSSTSRLARSACSSGERGVCVHGRRGARPGRRSTSPRTMWAHRDQLP